MSDEEESKCNCKAGLPAWMGTFADLMSLLMCFFVLLLSFSEMDAMKFKRLAGSMAQAFGVPAFPVDTHIHRLMYRWNLTNGKNVVQTEKDAKRLFPEELWNDLHLQIIWYGREYSPARGWNLDADIITKTIGRKTVIEAYYK